MLNEYIFEYIFSSCNYYLIMKNENIPADIKSKSLKEARDEIDEILVKLESKNFDLSNLESDYKRLINLNKHIETLFKRKSRELTNSKETNLDD